MPTRPPLATFPPDTGFPAKGAPRHYNYPDFPQAGQHRNYHCGKPGPDGVHQPSRWISRRHFHGRCSAAYWRGNYSCCGVRTGSPLNCCSTASRIASSSAAVITKSSNRAPFPSALRGLGCAGCSWCSPSIDSAHRSIHAPGRCWASVIDDHARRPPFNDFIVHQGCEGKMEEQSKYNNIFITIQIVFPGQPVFPARSSGATPVTGQSGRAVHNFRIHGGSWCRNRYESAAALGGCAGSVWGGRKGPSGVP